MNTDLNAVLTAASSVTLGGRAFPAAPLTFDSYARLQAWIKVHRPHPYQRLKAQKKQILRDLGPQEYNALLARAYEEGQSWPPSPLGFEGKRILLSDEDGGRELIRVALSQSGTELAGDELAAVAKSASAEEIAAFLDVAFGLSVRDQAERAVLEETDPSPKA